MTRRNRTIKDVKSVTLSDEQDFSSDHYDKRNTWTTITVTLKNGKEIKFGACPHGAVHKLDENDEQ